MKNKNALLFLVLVTLNGCASTPETDAQKAGLATGLKMEEVRKVMGEPAFVHKASMPQLSVMSLTPVKIWEYRSETEDKTTILYFCGEELKQVEYSDLKAKSWPGFKFQCEK